MLTIGLKDMESLSKLDLVHSAPIVIKTANKTISFGLCFCGKSIFMAFDFDGAFFLEFICYKLCQRFCKISVVLNRWSAATEFYHGWCCIGLISCCKKIRYREEKERLEQRRRMQEEMQIVKFLFLMKIFYSVVCIGPLFLPIHCFTYLRLDS